MPQQIQNTTENNFTGGLKTEFTGLNFPENACTDTDNCVFSVLGDVSRRPGFDLETNYIAYPSDFNGAITEYTWKSPAGSSTVQLLVKQIGAMIYFYRYSDITETVPLSGTKLAASINLNTFLVSDATEQLECQYAEGNGFLFIFHPAIDPLYVEYNAGSITARSITVRVRDFGGVFEDINAAYRPLTLNAAHTYNILNQGWSSNPQWSATSTTPHFSTLGSKAFTVAGGLTVVNGTNVVAIGYVTYINTRIEIARLTGTVTSYAGTTLTLNITAVGGTYDPTTAITDWTIIPTNVGLVTTWNTAEGNYPSNADIWWRFKNASGVFDPATTAPNVSIGSGPAPRGYFILDAFTLHRTATSGIPGLDNVHTTKRPSTGAWFQGRVWYSGVHGSQPAVNSTAAYNWSTNIYFSQVVENVSQLGMAYQNNDPTSEDFFDVLPTDGGVITIPEAGNIYKLFPIQNGLLVHASKGIWFITGSQGIGFAANDYTIVKISSIQTISGSSFVDVQGYPIFWNEEGIYSVTPSQTAGGGRDGGFNVENLCYGTISSFYADIPTISKMYAKGIYNPIDFEVVWTYRQNVETSVTVRYEYQNVLKFKTPTKAFFPYSIDTANVRIHGVNYIAITGSALTPDPVLKYSVSLANSGSVRNFTYAEEKETTSWKDWASYSPVDYISYFVTGYKLASKGLTKFQPTYLQMFSNADVPTAYKIQGIWDYSTSGNSGRYSTVQQVTNALSRFGIIIRKHKIRGRGLALQLKVQSVSGFPFNIIGWSSSQTVNTGM